MEDVLSAAWLVLFILYVAAFLVQSPPPGKTGTGPFGENLIPDYRVLACSRDKDELIMVILKIR